MSRANHVQLIGHVGQKPNIQQVSEQMTVCTFTLATNESYKDKQGVKQTKTEWHKIVAFGKIVQLLIHYVDKGSRIMCIGKLQTRQYVDKENNTRYVTEIVLEDIYFLDSRKEDSHGNQG